MPLKLLLCMARTGGDGDQIIVRPLQNQPASPPNSNSNEHSHFHPPDPNPADFQLDPDKSLTEQLSGKVLSTAPIWMDMSTTGSVKALEEAFGYEELTRRTGSRGYERFSAHQIRKRLEQQRFGRGNRLGGPKQVLLTRLSHKETTRRHDYRTHGVLDPGTALVGSCLRDAKHRWPGVDRDPCSMVSLLCVSYGCQDSSCEKNCSTVRVSDTTTKRSPPPSALPPTTPSPACFWCLIFCVRCWPAERWGLNYQMPLG